MKKDMFYRVVIILLLLVNVCTLGFLWMQRNEQKGDKGHRPPPPHRIIIERLGLDEKQRGEFKELRHWHHMQMVDIQRESSKLHSDLFALLQQPDIDTATKAKLLSEIQGLNLRREEVTFEHFRQLRGILRPEQDARFDEFVEEISRRIMGPHHEGKP